MTRRSNKAVIAISNIVENLSKSEDYGKEWSEYISIYKEPSENIIISATRESEIILLRFKIFDEKRFQIVSHRTNELNLQYKNQIVSKKWIISFVVHHAGALKKELIKKNKSVINANIKKTPQDTIKSQEILPQNNTPLPGSSFGSRGPQYDGFYNNSKHHLLHGNGGRDETNDGPLDDDWDSSDWERYMGGPNW